ncbi:thermonuclease family protein [Candidatus Pacearchaeota archaeon]|nr:thermonuclease family protein [Candidatus Pacearchaeota archaeon]
MPTRIFFVLLILLAPLYAYADSKTYGEAIVTEVTSIYDGDTFRANIEGFPAIIGERMAIRIAGIDTPEMRDKDPKVKELAQQAKQFTVKRLREGKHIVLKNIQRGKYFRIVADVYIDGVSLADELIKTGLAKPYTGGKKPDWSTDSRIIMTPEGELIEQKALQ